MDICAAQCLVFLTGFKAIFGSFNGVLNRYLGGVGYDKICHTFFANWAVFYSQPVQSVDAFASASAFSLQPTTSPMAFHLLLLVQKGDLVRSCLTNAPSCNTFQVHVAATCQTCCLLHFALQIYTYLLNLKGITPIALVQLSVCFCGVYVKWTWFWSVFCL